MKIGKKIRDIRKQKGLSQQELAALSGISQTYLSQLEKGERTSPTIEVMNKISDALSLPYPILEFLALEYKDIDQDKQEAFEKIESAVNAFIMEFVTSSNTKLNDAKSTSPV